jgi:CheY-like chemotaxis protein
VTTKTVLLVDDDGDFLRILGDRCERVGLRVERAHNLLNATMKVAERPPDMVCVDVELPTGNGLAFCEELAANASTANIPIIVVTGQTSAHVRKACEKLNAYYVEKTNDFWASLEPILRNLAAAPNGSAHQPAPSTIRSIRSEPKTNDRNLAKAPSVTNAGRVSDKKVVVADDDADLLQLLSNRFTSLGCSVIGVDNALDAINVIHRATPDLVCLDVSMPSGNGLSVCEMMAADERLREVPIIVLTGRSDENIIRRCHDLLVYYVQKRADTWDRVAPIARELLHLDKPAIAAEPKQWLANTLTDEVTKSDGERCDLVDAVFAVLGAVRGTTGAESDPGRSARKTADEQNDPWVLCIDDDPDFSDTLRIRLEEHGVAVVRAFNGLEGYRLAFTSPASAILLDFHMPNGQGDYILSRLKDNPVTKDIPVLVITGTRDKVLERRMLAMGAAAFFEKPIDFDKLRKQLANYVDILEPSAESPWKKFAAIGNS